MVGLGWTGSDVCGVISCLSNLDLALSLRFLIVSLALLNGILIHHIADIGELNAAEVGEV